MKNTKNENGAMMVEATLIFPMVLVAVMALLYLGIFKLQETAMLYQVQRVASQGGLMASNPGYARITENGAALDAKDIDWSSFPTETERYYEAFHENFLILYRELFGSSWIDEQQIENFGDEMKDSITFIAVGKLFNTDVQMKRDFWGTSIVAEIKFEVKAPGVFRYFKLPEMIVVKQAAYTRTVHPAGFIRNTDLAVDAVVKASEKLGLKDGLDKIVESIDKLTDILF